jgi:hypothetical protein
MQFQSGGLHFLLSPSQKVRVFMMISAVISPRNHPLYSFFISAYQHNLKLGVNPNIRKMKTGGK